MNKSFYNQENIDAYLTNKLNGADKILFENGLDKDPLIQNEINLQKEIIESLKETRKAELKNRLKNIEVEGLANSFRYKVAASILIMLGLFSGTYFFLTQEQGAALNNASQDVQPVVKPSNTQPIDNKYTPLISFAPENTISAQPESNADAIQEPLVATQPNVRKPVLIPNESLEVTSPNIKENFEDNDIKTEANLAVPEGNVIHDVDTYKSDIELSIQPNGENNFHYKYYSNKLYLYCDFQSKPYELLEWNGKKTKQLYLFFNNTYYQLKHNQTEITPLKPINDKQLIKQLEGIKEK